MIALELDRVSRDFTTPDGSGYRALEDVSLAVVEGPTCVVVYGEARLLEGAEAEAKFGGPVHSAQQRVTRGHEAPSERSASAAAPRPSPNDPLMLRSCGWSWQESVTNRFGAGVACAGVVSR